MRHDGYTACDEDPEGAEFADMQAVRSEAIAGIKEILAERLYAGAETSDGEMIIKDESRETVLTIPFSMRVRIGEPA
jgi:hypothetical protein